MPPRLGTAIQTQQGVRRLLPDELAKGLGVPAEWGDLTAYPGSLLNTLTGIHTREAIGRAISPLFEESTEGPTSPPDNQPSSGVPSAHRPLAASSTHTDSQFHSEEGQFEWVKPDLSPGSPWHLARIYNLIDACKGLRDRNQQFLNGLADLDRHRANYGPDGIQQLRVIWCDFPSERDDTSQCSGTTTGPFGRPTTTTRRLCLLALKWRRARQLRTPVLLHLMGEATLSSGSPWHLARIYSLVDACKGPRARNQQFFNELADLVCHLAVRRKHSTVVMTGTHSTPTKNPPFPTRPRWHPVGAHLCSGPTKRQC
jgi:hypothetical protein